MIKKILFVVCGFFVFISNIVIAETLKKEDTIKINDIQMVAHVASKVVAYSAKNKIDITDENSIAIDVPKIRAEHDVLSAKHDALIIHCELMDVISDLHRDAISDAEKTDSIISKAKKMNDDTKVTIYVNKDTTCIQSMLIT